MAAEKDLDADKDAGPRPPVWYGKHLAAARESLGYLGGDGRARFAREHGFDYNRVWRNETGEDRRSVKASRAIRNVLIKLGADVLPVPTDPNEPEPADALRLHGHGRDPSDPKASTKARNLRRLREEAGYDLAGAADKLRLRAETLDSYESGVAKPSDTLLEEIARAYGHSIGDFWQEDAAQIPPTTLEPLENVWYRRRTWNDLEPRYREIFEEEMEMARHRAELRILDAAAATPPGAAKVKKDLVAKRKQTTATRKR